jgi:hypothetical protein
LINLQNIVLLYTELIFNLSSLLMISVSNKQ